MATTSTSSLAQRGAENQTADAAKAVDADSWFFILKDSFVSIQ